MTNDGNAMTHGVGNLGAPFFVVNPGEAILTAIDRHRRDTGYHGSCILVAINRGAPPLANRAASAALAAA